MPQHTLGANQEATAREALSEQATSALSLDSDNRGSTRTSKRFFLSLLAIFKQNLTLESTDASTAKAERLNADKKAIYVWPNPTQVVLINSRRFQILTLRVGR